MTIQSAVEILNYSSLSDRYTTEFTEAICVVTAFFEIMGVCSYVFPPSNILGMLSPLQRPPDVASP